MAFSALSFFFVIIVPLQVNDEPNVSLIQTLNSVQLPLTANKGGHSRNRRLGALPQVKNWTCSGFLARNRLGTVRRDKQAK
jgi:hypothetical protein